MATWVATSAFSDVCRRRSHPSKADGFCGATPGSSDGLMNSIRPCTHYATTFSSGTTLWAKLTRRTFRCRSLLGRRSDASDYLGHGHGMIGIRSCWGVRLFGSINVHGCGPPVLIGPPCFGSLGAQATPTKSASTARHLAERMCFTCTALFSDTAAEHALRFIGHSAAAQRTMHPEITRRWSCHPYVLWRRS